MYFVYILHSSKSDRYYIGTSADVEERLKKHNTRHKGFTSQSNDWLVVYTETFELKTEALLREKQLKSWKSRICIQKLIQKGQLD